MNEIELAWAAGFFDGEGSTLAHQQGIDRRPGHAQHAPRRTYLRLMVNQAVTDGHDGVPEVLLRLRDALGGNILGPYEQRRTEHERELGRGYRRTTYRWYAHAAAGEAALELLWPFLGTVKREQAERVRAIMAAEHETYGHTKSCSHAA